MSLSIVYITSGAGGMYCGSCLRDNTLARALMRLGCQVELLPTYTPIRTDEPDASSDQVFFGGINVFLQQKLPLARWWPRWMDHWLDRPGLLRWATRGRIRTDARLLGELTVSMLAGEHGRQRKEVERLVDYLAADARPQLVNFSNILIAGCVPTLKRKWSAPVLVTLQGDDLFLGQLPPPFQAQALAHIERIGREIDGFITFSEWYADFLAHWLRLPRRKFFVVPLGIDVADLPTEHAPRNDGTLTLGYLARHCPEKGWHRLVDAFIRLRQRPEFERLRLASAGWLGASDRPFFERQVARLRDARLESDYDHRGEVDRAGKAAFLRDIDVLCVPTTYREPKGLFVLEALAAGVPVLLPAHGAFPELLASTGGGQLFAAEDDDQLVELLALLLANAELRQQLGAAGQRRVRTAHTADAMAHATLDVYRRLIGVP